MFYIRTADRLRAHGDVARTSSTAASTTCESVIIDDALGIGAELEAEMQHHVDTYECEWKATVEDPARVAKFRSFINAMTLLVCDGQSPYLESRHVDRVCAFDDLLPDRGSCALVGRSRWRCFVSPGRAPSTPFRTRPVQRRVRDVARHRRVAGRRREGGVADLQADVRSAHRRVPRRRRRCRWRPIPCVSSTAACRWARRDAALLGRRRRRGHAGRPLARVQADLTAVERFSQRHGAARRPGAGALLPRPHARRPAARGAAVRLRRRPRRLHGMQGLCGGVSLLNGLDEGESWRKVSPSRTRRAVPADRHRGVPPLRRPRVHERLPGRRLREGSRHRHRSHLDDQCIGCALLHVDVSLRGAGVQQAPRHRAQVRHVLGPPRRGEAPACVQGCPNEAITITVVDVARHRSTASSTVPGARRRRSRPTTTYRSEQGHRQLHRTANAAAHGHPPLAVMLVLTQLAVGAFVTDFALRTFTSRARRRFDAFAHRRRRRLGARRQRVAPRAAALRLPRRDRLRHSWLSREIVAFGAFMGLAVPYAAAMWLGWSVGGVGRGHRLRRHRRSDVLGPDLRDDASRHRGRRCRCRRASSAAPRSPVSTTVTWAASLRRRFVAAAPSV